MIPIIKENHVLADNAAFDTLGAKIGQWFSPKASFQIPLQMGF